MLGHEIERYRITPQKMYVKEMPHEIYEESGRHSRSRSTVYPESEGISQDFQLREENDRLRRALIDKDAHIAELKVYIYLYKNRDIFAIYHFLLYYIILYKYIYNYIKREIFL